MKESKAFEDPEASLSGGISTSPQERWREEAAGEGHIKIHL